VSAARRAVPADAAEPLQLASRIPHDVAAASLLDYLVRRFPYLDRDGWTAEVEAGRLSLDGRPARLGTVVHAGQRLVWSKPHREPEVARDVQILHADQHLVVVDKPAHLPSHADGPFVRNTLIHIVRERLGAPDLRLVHRLDRETSGVCVLAHTEAARAFVAEQFARSTAAKTYVAVVRGAPTEPVFEVDRAIGRAAASAIALRRSAAADARDPKPARTAFEVLRVVGERASIRCTPRTGRTHQIRVHLEAIGHPVLGDKLYGRPDADYLAFVQRVKAGGSPADVPAGEPHRHLLHAERLAIVHPATGESVAWQAPTPAEFTNWLERPGG